MNLSQTRQNLTKFDHTFSFLFVTSVQIRTHKSKDKLTSPHINSQDNIGFDLAKCAAQLLYGPVLVLYKFGPRNIQILCTKERNRTSQYSRLTDMTSWHDKFSYHILIVLMIIGCDTV